MPEASSRNPVVLQTIGAWAGETIFKRGQDYQLRGRVHELATTSSGELLAWVQGSSRYATRVVLGKESMSADCTCPYGGICKHAVAVILAYLNRAEQAPPLPLATPNDPRIVLLDHKAAAAAIVSAPPTISEPRDDPALTAFLTALSHQELVVLVLEMAPRFPELRDALAVRQMLATDDADQLEAEVLGRIVAARAAPSWGDRYPPQAWSVVQDYPDRAAQIWQQLAEARIAQTNPAAYQEAALFLCKLRRVQARQGKEVAWREYAVKLRETNRRKRRLVETLDVLLQEVR
jgi:uncharacterized Zn finger protein